MKSNNKIDIKADDGTDNRKADRRCFLQTSLSIAGGIILSYFSVPTASAGDSESKDKNQAKNSQKSAGTDLTAQPEFFIRISRENNVEVIINRLEFGQGIATTFAMLVAEELDFPFEKITYRCGTNHLAYVDPVAKFHLTGGSSSVKNSYLQYRKVAATARDLLRQAAAAQWKADLSLIKTDQGELIYQKQRLSYGQVSEAAAKLPIPSDVTLKSRNQFKVIGKSARRLDGPSIVTGSKTFGMDFKISDEKLSIAMLIQNPCLAGGKVTALDAVRGSQVKGVKAIFKVSLSPTNEAVAIIADSFWNAKKARDLLDVSFETPSAAEKISTDTLRQDFKERALKPDATVFDWQQGGSAVALETASQKMLIEYEFPYLAHAAMEPLNCTIDLRPDSCSIWTGTQSPGSDARSIATILGLPLEKVEVNVLPAGGGFGRRATLTSDVASISAKVAKTWQSHGGKGPVKIIWTREDDMTSGYYRPMHIHRAELGFGPKGNLVAWDHTIVGQSITAGSPIAGAMIKDGADRLSTEGLAENTYGLPMRLRVSHPQVPVPVLWWRSVGHSHTAFVSETIIDAIARQAKQDPVSFRRKRFRADEKQFDRHLKALDLAVAKSGYGKRKLAPGSAWGVAVHASFGSVVAYIAEVSIEDKRPIVHRITAGVHCNLVVNPLAAAAQIEGAMMYGATGMIPGSAITIAAGRAEQNQFTDFQVPRIGDCPRRVDVHFVPSTEPPTGLGEPGLPPYLPAVANAIAKLTGKLYSKLPFQEIT
jgi:isoquinoline 1-oxidoreductase beta subunit